MKVALKNGIELRNREKEIREREGRRRKEEKVSERNGRSIWTQK